MLPIGTGWPQPLDTSEAVMLTPEMLMWRGGNVVLFLEYHEERWIVARGWLSGDELRHIRRWFFGQPAAAIGQVRRLVRDAGGDFDAAKDAGSQWLERLGLDEPATFPGDYVRLSREPG